jgi:hypothetical protein
LFDLFPYSASKVTGAIMVVVAPVSNGSPEHGHI